MTECAALRPKTYNYLINHGDENKKLKGTKKYVIKHKLKFADYKLCLEATQLTNLKKVVLEKMIKNLIKTIN